MHIAHPQIHVYAHVHTQMYTHTHIHTCIYTHTHVCHIAIASATQYKQCITSRADLIGMDTL